MSITIHPDLEARLRARAEADGVTVEVYIERLARDDEQAERELEGLALAGLSSGEPIAGDEKFWKERRRRLMERHPNTQDR